MDKAKPLSDHKRGFREVVKGMQAAASSQI
jgi:hypothetical protein